MTYWQNGEFSIWELHFCMRSWHSFIGHLDTIRDLQTFSWQKWEINFYAKACSLPQEKVHGLWWSCHKELRYLCHHAEASTEKKKPFWFHSLEPLCTVNIELFRISGCAKYESASWCQIWHIMCRKDNLRACSSKRKWSETWVQHMGKMAKFSPALDLAQAFLILWITLRLGFRCRNWHTNSSKDTEYFSQLLRPSIQNWIPKTNKFFCPRWLRNYPKR